MIPASVLSSGRTYVTSLQPCFYHGCLPPFTSQTVTLTHPSSVRLTVNETKINNVKDGAMNVEAMAALKTADDEVGARMAIQPCVVQWTVSRDNHAAVSLTGWAVQQAQDCGHIQVSEPLNGLVCCCYCCCCCCCCCCCVIIIIVVVYSFLFRLPVAGK
jgi:hypothetical protein